MFKQTDEKEHVKNNMERLRCNLILILYQQSIKQRVQISNLQQHKLVSDHVFHVFADLFLSTGTLMGWQAVTWVA